MPYINWLILFFVHFALFFLIKTNKEQKLNVSVVSSNLLVIYAFHIISYLIISYFDIRFITSILITSSVYLVYYFLSKKSFNNFKFNSLKLSHIIIVSLSAVIFAFLVKSLYSTTKFEYLDYYIIDYGYVYAFTFICLIPSIFEEVFFRSHILNLLSVNFSKINSIIISSVLFGIAHFIFLPIISFVYLFIMGCILGYIKLKFKNIIYCIIFHLMYNTLVVIIL